MVEHKKKQLLTKHACTQREDKEWKCQKKSLTYKELGQVAKSGLIEAIVVQSTSKFVVYL